MDLHAIILLSLLFSMLPLFPAACQDDGEYIARPTSSVLVPAQMLNNFSNIAS